MHHSFAAGGRLMDAVARVRCNRCSLRDSTSLTAGQHCSAQHVAELLLMVVVARHLMQTHPSYGGGTH